MKRQITAAIVLLLLFTACVPTPKTEFIVNKGDGVLEQRLTESTEDGEAARARAAFPAHWRSKVETPDGVTVTFDAPIEQKADGVYPVYRTRRAELDGETAAKLLDALLPAPALMCSAEPTKAQLTEEFQRFLTEVDRMRDAGDNSSEAWTEEQIAEETQRCIDAINAAPDAPDPVPISDYRAIPWNEPTRIALKDGDSATVELRKSGIWMHRGGAWTYDEAHYREDLRLEEENAALWQPVTERREDAERLLWDALESLGMTDFRIAFAYPANLISDGVSPYSVATGWQFELLRDYGGYPMLHNLHSAQRFLYGEEATVNRPIEEESILAFVAADGIRNFYYGVPKSVVGLVNGNVQLLPFSQIRQLAERALSTGLTQRGAGDYEVYRIVLTTFTLRERDSDDYLEMPCWVFYFDSELRRSMRDNPCMAHDAMILNAVDGSVIHTEY